MRRYYYDLHIHTVLSPCGDEDMTPCNIVGMAKLIGLDVIAVSDHNSIGNVRAVMDASARLDGPLIIPAMELETSEEIHVLTLFPEVTAAEAFQKLVAEKRFKIANRPDIFGVQRYLDAFDAVVAEEKDLLTVSTSIGFDEIPDLMKAYEGVAVPAHINRPSHGVLEILGEFTRSMGFSAAEVGRNGPGELTEKLRREGFAVVHNSDAHFLEAMNEREENFLELAALSEKSVLRALRNI